MDDEFRERLAGLKRSGRRRARKHARRAPAALDDLGGTVKTDGVLIIQRSLSEIASEGAVASLLREFAGARRSALSRDDIDEGVRSVLTEPRGALFFDTETTGLGGNMVFLLGVMRVGDDDVTLRQVFARDYTEEPALLSAWSEMAAGAEFLVSFNGKSFDLPVLRDRLGLYGMEPPPEPPHLDLLHHARRRWSGILPDCRLQTLEWQVCGRRRAGDIPGEEIPSVYHHFVRTGESPDILTVFHHNALDLITLADITLALAAPEDEPA